VESNGASEGKGPLKSEHVHRTNGIPRKDKDSVIAIGKWSLKTIPHQKRKKVRVVIQSPLAKRVEIELKIPKLFETFRFERETTPSLEPNGS
jgi:hypothetical protein